MKIKNIFGNVGNSIKAFPLAHILLVTHTSLVIISICMDNYSPLLGNLIIACGLSLLFSLYEPIFTLQSNNKSSSKRLLILGIIIPIIFGIIYFFIIKNQDIFNGILSNSQLLSYLGIFILAIVGLFTLLAWTSKNDENKTWYSWLGIIASGFMGGVACGIIGGGIAGALAAIEALFDVYIGSIVYQIMRAIIGILISGSFILNYYQYLISNANDVKATNAWSSRIRKIFGNYIFFGLTLIYIAIFLVYGIKILITGVRPKGIIVRLGIGYFSLGLITTFLIHPQESKFSDIVKKGIDFSFLFTSFMMICAIYQRVNQYGFTMNRYFICAIILLIIVYAILSLIKSKNRRLIFSSVLFVISLLSIYGPVNARHIALHSQVYRLKRGCIEQNISLPIYEGGLSELTGKNASDMYDSFYNLFDNYEIEEWNQGLIDGEFINSLTGDSRYEIRNQIFDYISLHSERWYEDNYDDEGNKIIHFDFYTSDEHIYPINIEGYSQFYDVSSRVKCYDSDGTTKEDSCRIEDNKREFEGDIVDFNLYKDEILNAKSGSYPIILDFGTFKLIITSIYGEIYNDESIKLTSFYGYLLKK